jgi:hypothetical protein
MLKRVFPAAALPLLFVSAGCPDSAAERCFSPTQNLRNAYDDDATGCPCSDEEDMCVPTEDGGDVALVCDEGKWLAVEDGPCFPLPENDCFSPTQNLDLAYDDGAVGCACQDEASQCMPDSAGSQVALVCESGQWQAVLDGPCEPAPEDCYSPEDDSDGYFDFSLTGCACDSEQSWCVPGEPGLVFIACVDGHWAPSDAGECGESPECYSPDQNLHLAYDPTAEGCRCQGEESFCIAGDTSLVQLSCVDGQWQSGQDGECAWAPSHAFEQYVVGQSCRAFVENENGERQGIVLEFSGTHVSLWVQLASESAALSEWQIDGAYTATEQSNELAVVASDLEFERILGEASEAPSALTLTLRNIAVNAWEVGLTNAGELPAPLPFTTSWFNCVRDETRD